MDGKRPIYEYETRPILERLIAGQVTIDEAMHSLDEVIETVSDSAAYEASEQSELDHS